MKPYKDKTILERVADLEKTVYDHELRLQVLEAKTKDRKARRRGAKHIISEPK